MPKFQTEVTHNLGREQAVQRLSGFLNSVREKYKDQVSHLESTWNDNRLDFRLKTYGFDISGSLTVDERQARLEGQLPFAAAPFRGKIEKSIAGELEKALA